MKLPSRIVDISVTLDNDTVLDPPSMRPHIEYRTNSENAWMLLEGFPGLRQEDLPNGEGWACEVANFSTHNGTHMDAPIHYQSKTIDGGHMMSIDEIPLDWCFRPGVKLDFRHFEDGYVVQTADIEAELQRIGQALRDRGVRSRRAMPRDPDGAAAVGRGAGERVLYGRACARL